MPTNKKSSGSKSGSKSTGSKSASSKSSSRSGTARSGSASSKSGKSTASKSGSKSAGGSKSASKSTSSAGSRSKSSTSSRSGSTGSKSGSSSAKRSTGSSKPAGTRSTAKKSTSSSKSRSTRTATASTKRSTGSAKRSDKSDGRGLISSALDAVTGFFSGGQDAISLLKEDHRKVEGLFAKVKENEDGNNAATFKKIKEELDVHAHIEENIFYPHLLDKGDKELKKIVREGLEEHSQVKDLLTELSGLSGDTPTFKAKITVLMENVEHHVEEEENEMFSMVEDQIPEDTLQRLGSLMQGEKMKVKKMKPASKPRSRTASAGAR